MFFKTLSHAHWEQCGTHHRMELMDLWEVNLPLYKHI